MTKVYVVTSGQWSDYGINGVFSTKEKAEAYKAAFKCDNIEEYELDRWFAEIELGYIPFLVRISPQGEVKEVYIDTEPSEAEGIDVDGNFYFSIMAKDQTTAIKIANEKRVYAIATNQFD